MTDNLPIEVAKTLDALGCGVVRRVESIGTAISQAAFVETTQNRLFVKWRFDPPFEMFGAEVDGLDRLRQTRTLRVPEIVGTNYWAATEEWRAFAYIAMEYVPNRKAREVKAFSQRFAHDLATLHKTSITGQKYGLDIDNFLGRQLQINVSRTDDWPAFYRDYRRLPQIEFARQNGLLPAGRERDLMQLVEVLDKLLDGLPNEASLIHGDLWHANFLCATRNEEPVLIDPAVYYAPREMEMAYIELFGSFPPHFRENYDAVFPLDKGYERRRALHQLYPLLIHLNHFGEQYGDLVDYVCRQYR